MKAYIKHTIITLFCFIAGLQVSIAQKIEFKQKLCNLGSVMWKTPVTARFQFQNKEAGTPLRIDSIDTGCGCVKVQYTHGDIAKGETGEIALTYDAMLLGHFDRIIEVYTNASNRPERLRMKGKVSVNSASGLSHAYPIRIDNICLNTNNIEFPDVLRGDSTTISIEIFNDGTEVFTPRLMHIPPYINAKMIPEMIARGRRGQILLTLDGSKVPNLGLNQTSIYLARFSGDHVGPNNEIMLSAVLLPDMQNLENGSKQPQFSLSTPTINIGKLGKKTKVKSKVIISNNGNAVLSIKKIQAFNQALTINLPKTDIEPGQSVKMEVELNTSFLKNSKANPRILIITNDPLHCKEIIDVIIEK